MKKHVKQLMLVVFTAVLAAAGAAAAVIVGYADESPEYRTLRIDYLFADGKTAHDSYIAVFEKGKSVVTDVTNPIIKGYSPVDSLGEGAQPAETSHIKCTLNENYRLKVYYVPETVPYSVRYFTQNIYDDDYSPVLNLDDRYYHKSGLTGTFPSELENVPFEGFTKLYHKPDFIAADGSTEFELYYNRNYYLINFDLNGGHGVEPVYAKYESTFNIPEPAKKGYIFEGWVLADSDGKFVDESGNPLTDPQALVYAQKNKFTSGIVPDHNVNYKAYWSAGIAQYTVIYWIEDPDSDQYTDVATQTITQYRNETAVKTGDTLDLEDRNEIPDFFTDYNLNPQKVQKENGNVVLDNHLRPIYLTNDRGEPIDEQGNVLDFPDMSPGEREQFNGKGRYFEINTALSSDNVEISGDGTTKFNVYYKRKPITQRFFFARKKPDGKYQIPGYTKAFSTAGGTLDQHLSDQHEGRTDWMWLSDDRPQIAEKYQDKLTVKEYKPTEGPLAGYTYYYYELQTEYYSNMRENWLEDAFEPYEITNNKSEAAEGEKDYARFGAWSAEWGTPYAVPVNSTVKGIYEKLDDQLLYSEEYLQEGQGNGYGANPYVLNYLSFWANAKNQNWNKKSTYYNFTYKNYVEILPSEYTDADPKTGDRDWNQKGGYVDTVKVVYNDPNSQVNNTKIYGLLPQNIIETYDGGTQYTTECGSGKKYTDRDHAIRVNQTAAALTGFALLTDAEIAKADKLPYNTVCDWYTNEKYTADGFDADHHCDVKFFYRRRYYTLGFLNNNVKSNDVTTRNIYYQMDINSTGIRGNWVYYEPVYPDADMSEYYQFDGWYFDAAHTEKVQIIENDPAYENDPAKQKHFNDPFRMPADDVTLYAKWSLVKENVRFYNDYEAYSTSEDPISSCEPEYNSLILTQYIPTTNHEDNRPDLTPPVTDATFTGWYYVNEAGEELRFEPENIPVVRELNLYAKWTSTKTAGYTINYVEAGTNTPVADSTTGVAFVSSTKSFNAKPYNELYEAYQPQDGQKSWWPAVNSHSLLIEPNGADNTFSFEYTQKGTVHYKVRYLDAATLEPLFDFGENTYEKIYETSLSVVSETYLPKDKYIPDRVIKTLTLSASTKEDPDQAKAEELAANVITFLYTKNETLAPVRVEYWLQNVDGNPNNKSDYKCDQTDKFDKPLDSVIDFATEIYGSAMAKEYTDNHFVINEDLTEVNDAHYTGETVTVDGKRLVIKVYFKRNYYPYKVLYVDLEQEKLYNESQGQIPDNGVLKTIVYGTEENERKPLGAVVNIEYPSSITTTDGTVYYPQNTNTHTLTIVHEVFDAQNPDPKVNVEKVYYTKQKPRWHIHYNAVCVNPIGDVDEDFALLSPDNKEIFDEDATTWRGCTAMANPAYGSRYTFLGWYKSASLNQDDYITDAAKFVPESRPPQRETHYYALFSMDSAPCTFNYIYQGRMGGNTGGSYIGDDAATDEKIYTVSLTLTQENVDENGNPLPKTYIDNAPAVEDLYKKCVWTIDDEHVVFDGKTRTATITADQRAMLYSVKFYYNNDIYDVQRVQLNTQVRPNGSYVVAPQTDAEGQPFAYWLVEENGREVAKCFNKAFDLRITGDSIVTACYGETAKSVTISNAEYSRQQYTDAKTGKQVDKLYADFIVAYMDDQGTMLNPEYSSDPETSRQYKSGVIVQYSQNQQLTKANAPGAKLSEADKKVFPEGDVLTKENAKELAKGNSLDTGYTYYVSDIANGKYNNRNRLDKALSFNNSETARRLVLCAYYYVWNTKTGEFEMAEPVYFYLYDIGNSVKENKEN